MKTIIRFFVAILSIIIGIALLPVPFPLLSPAFFLLALIVFHPRPDNFKWYHRIIQQVPVLLIVQQYLSRFSK